MPEISFFVTALLARAAKFASQLPSLVVDASRAGFCDLQPGAACPPQVHPKPTNRSRAFR